MQQTVKDYTEGNRYWDIQAQRCKFTARYTSGKPFMEGPRCIWWLIGKDGEI